MTTLERKSLVGKLGKALQLRPEIVTLDLEGEAKSGREEAAGFLQTMKMSAPLRGKDRLVRNDL